MKPTKPLSQMQYNFVTNYIKNGSNATQAALKAGYARSVATCKTKYMINQPEVKQRILSAYDKLNAKQDNGIFMTLEQRCKVLNQIIFDIVPQDGSEPKRKHYNEALKAIAELNKMAGDYAPDKRLSVTVDATKERLDEARKRYEEY